LTFNAAIEKALNDGFTGFRAAADMSWAMGVKFGARRLIAYEAMLRGVFATTSATGLCLYRRDIMPLKVLNGALLTHPVAGVKGRFQRNPFFRPEVATLPNVAINVPAKLRSLSRPAARSRKPR
jgi:hypothetical protein